MFTSFVELWIVFCLNRTDKSLFQIYHESIMNYFYKLLFASFKFNFNQKNICGTELMNQYYYSENNDELMQSYWLKLFQDWFLIRSGRDNIKVKRVFIVMSISWICQKRLRKFSLIKNDFLDVKGKNQWRRKGDDNHEEGTRWTIDRLILDVNCWCYW